MINRFGLATLLFLPLLAMAAPQSEIVPSDIMSQIRTDGAAKVLRKQLSDQNSWRAIYMGISSGDPEWLDVAAAFYQVSDGGDSEGLNIALFFALKNSPSGVLTKLVDLKNATFVCSGQGGVAFDSDPPPKQVQAWINERIAAVRTVNAPNLVSIRDTCIYELKNIKKLMQKHG
jgi:hypothetical protein